MRYAALGPVSSYYIGYHGIRVLWAEVATRRFEIIAVPVAMAYIPPDVRIAFINIF